MLAVTDGEFRRASWHMDFIYQLGGIREDDERMHVQFHNEGGDIEFSPAKARVYDTVTLPRTIFGEHFSYLEVAGHEGRAEAHDPVAEHGALPQRAALHRLRRVPRHGGVLERPERRLRAGDRAAARARLHVPADGRHVLRVSQRREPAPGDRGARRGRRRPPPALHQADQRGGRRQARGHDADGAHVPRQLPLLVGRRGRLRLRRRAAALRARRRRLLHGVRRRPLGRLRAAALRRPRTSSSCSAWSRRSAPSSSPRTRSSAGSRRPASTCRWSSSASRRSAASRRPSRATR